MKKPANIITPCLCLALGFLVLLSNLNLLAANGNAYALTIGITALIVGILYLGLGVIAFFPQIKLGGNGKKALDVCTVALFPVLVFVEYLVNVIAAEGDIQPAGWIIAILVLVSSLGVAILFALNKFLQKGLKPFVLLAAGLFGTALLLTILFSFDGNAVNLGNINLVGVISYALYGGILGMAITAKEPEPEPEPEGEEPAPEGEPEPEPEPEGEVQEESAEEGAPEEDEAPEVDEIPA